MKRIKRRCFWRVILNNQGTRNRIRFTRELQVSQIQALVPIQKLLKRNLTMILTLKVAEVVLG